MNYRVATKTQLGFFFRCDQMLLENMICLVLTIESNIHSSNNKARQCYFSSASLEKVVERKVNQHGHFPVKVTIKFPFFFFFFT